MQHMDEACAGACKFLIGFLDAKGGDWHVLLIKDAFARLRAILWSPKWEEGRRAIDEGLGRASSVYWSGSVLRGCSPGQAPDGRWQDDAWHQAGPVEGSNRLRVLERHLTKAGWFQAPDEPPWPAEEADAPAIALFYSFKGGVGRSTALAASALHLASRGDRVVVLDADLDSPGVGWLLSGLDGGIASWGVVDYLIEQSVMDMAERSGLDVEGLGLEEYHHRVPRSFLPDGEEIFVFPAGASGDGYVDKLARLDYGIPRIQSKHPFVTLLRRIRRELDPGWILIDARAGLGDVSGFLTGGLCHLHVLFGTMADASRRGLGMMLDRLGRDRLLRGTPQAECVTVAAMIPRTQEALYRESVERFEDRGRELFSDHYYAKPEAGEDLWTLDDVENRDAPHVPVVLPYDERLAVFHDLGEVAESILLKDEPYGVLAKRLRESFERLKVGTG